MDAKTLREFAKMVKQDNTATNPYDSEAEVVRVDGDVTWVHIPGGVDETPVSMAVSAKPGDKVRVRVSGGRAWITGNDTAPPTDDTKAEEAEKVAVTAVEKATTAQESAEEAANYAEVAKQAADSAQGSADNANEYASRALANLSTVQSVSETLTWITRHGTMSLTTDTEIDPTHVYFVVDANGDYVVGSTHYSVVTEPAAADLGSYYVLSIDESLNNYVATHLALTGEGLWVLPASTGFKVLIATGNGTTYTSAGTYIIDASGNTVAQFGASAVVGKVSQSHVLIDKTKVSIYGHDGVYNVAQIGSRNDPSTGIATVTETLRTDDNIEIGGNTYYCLATTLNPISITSCTYSSPDYPTPTSVNVNIYDDNIVYSSTFDDSGTATITYTTGGNATFAAFNGAADEGVRSFASGEDCVASGGNSAAFGTGSEAEGYGAFAEGHSTSSGRYAHSEGASTVASGDGAHAEGISSVASGSYSHTEGASEASGNFSHAEGADAVASGTYAHAQNYGTIAASMSQTAIGSCNVEDDTDQNIFIIGNGEDTQHRSNAFTVDWDGNTRASGTVTAGSYADNNKAFHSITRFIKGDTPNTTTSSGGFILDDRNGDGIGRFDGYFWDDGYEGVRVGTAKNDVGNYLRLGVDGNGNRRVLVNGAEVWRDALGFGLLQCIATDTSGSSSSKTLTYTLESGGIYVIVIDKINTTSTNYVGLYIAGIHTNSSNVKAISSATSATVSVSTTTLTVALSATYMKAAIYRVA